MLDEVGLVHMNGRIYDPYLGRMLTADILVSYPERSTSFNRYAYALNNPLRFVDPSGWDVLALGLDSVPNYRGLPASYSLTTYLNSNTEQSNVVKSYGSELSPMSETKKVLAAGVENASTASVYLNFLEPGVVESSKAWLYQKLSILIKNPNISAKQHGKLSEAMKIVKNSDDMVEMSKSVLNTGLSKPSAKSLKGLAGYMKSMGKALPFVGMGLTIGEEGMRISSAALDGDQEAVQNLAIAAVFNYGIDNFNTKTGAWVGLKLGAGTGFLGGSAFSKDPRVIAASTTVGGVVGAVGGGGSAHYYTDQYIGPAIREALAGPNRRQ